jgi:hypothetical protein
VLFYKPNFLFRTAIHVGHQQKVSELRLSFFYSGIVNKSILLYRVKHIVYAFLKIKSYLFSVMHSTLPFLFVFAFSKLDDFLVVSKIVETKLSLSTFIHDINLVLEPTGGFLASKDARYLKQKQFNTPLNFSYSRLFVLSFGDAALPVLIKETISKSVILFGLVDTNQKRVVSGVDYIIPGNDDSIVVAYFISVFFFNILFC